jgi:hypothetical protein
LTIVRPALVLLAAVLTALPILAAPAAAQTYSCRGYPPVAVVAQLKSRVEALRRVEREAADRLVGLDTRPYEWLLGQARAGEAAIAVAALLAAEERLLRCPNIIQPLRRDCAMGAASLVRVIEELVAGEASHAAKLAYAQTMRPCERSTGLTPIETALRASE